MANRFPSLEEFDAGQTALAPGETAEGGSFLDRERAALGDDADFFSTPGDNLATTVEDGGDDEDDLLGGGGNNYNDGANEGISDFESSFPAIDTSTENTASAPSYYPPPSFREPVDEPEVIKQWRSKRDADLAARDKVSADRKAATEKEAQEAIDEFYRNFTTKSDKAIAQTRREAEEFLASRDDTTAGGTSWDRIGKLVDLSGKGTKGGAGGSGKERMRELLISLRKDEKAPGATGY